MAWLDNNYLYRKKITIQNVQVAGDLTNFPAVYWETDTDLQKALANGFDFKVSKGEDTEVPYERQLWNDATGEIILWIKTDPLAASDVDYYLYYGYAGETVDQQDAAGTWDNGYVGVWHMEEGNLKDSSGNVADGTNQGTTDDTNGVIEHEREFDGIDDYVDMGDATNLDGATVATFEAWIDVANWDDDAIMRKWRAGSQAYIFGLRGTDELQITIRDASGNQLNTETTNANLSTGTRYYVVGVWSGGNSRKFIIDGTIEPTMNDITAGSPTSIDNVDEHFAIGARYNDGSPDNFFDGQMDELRQSNVVRSDEWIETSYNNINDPSTFWVTGAEETQIAITHTTDSFIVSRPLLTHTTDSFLLDKVELTHTTDSVLKKLDNEITHTTDSVLRQIDNELTHTTDSFLLKIQTVTHTTDSVCGEREPGITVVHQTDSVFKKLDNEITHTTDSFIVSRPLLTHTTDSVLREIDNELTHTTDSILKKLDNELTHTTDSQLVAIQELTHTTDSVLGEREPGFTIVHTTDSILKKLDNEITHTTDSVLGEREPGFTITHTTDSVLLKTNEINHTTDSVLRQIDNEITHTTDSVLGEREPGFTIVHTTDSILKKLDNEINHTTDSYFFQKVELTHTTDSFLLDKVDLTHTTDSILKKLDNLVVHTTDSVCGERDPGFTVTHTTDSVLKLPNNELCHFTDSYLRRTRWPQKEDILVFIPTTDDIVVKIQQEFPQSI